MNYSFAHSPFPDGYLVSSDVEVVVLVMGQPGVDSGLASTVYFSIFSRPGRSQGLLYKHRHH